MDKLVIGLPLINVILAKKLIRTQFPEWADLPIERVKISGWDNRTFRLGSKMLIRMPSAKKYAPQVPKEQQWLPMLSSQISVQIPKSIAFGQPSNNYPWKWSIYNWIEGESLDQVNLIDSVQIAFELAEFIKELHNINTVDGPIAGEHNFYRGGSLRIYDSEVKRSIKKLKELIPADEVIAVWEKALESEWQNKPVWIHGDFVATNILVNYGKVAAVIDFGSMGVGDPACDLVIAWNYFSARSRRAFKESLEFDSNTWARARGWALWKYLIMLVELQDIKSSTVHTKLNEIDDIMREHQQIYRYP